MGETRPSQRQSYSRKLQTQIALTCSIRIWDVVIDVVEHTVKNVTESVVSHDPAHRYTIIQYIVRSDQRGGVANLRKGNSNNS